MNPLSANAFDVPDRLSAKADPALIADDQRHFAAIARTLQESIAELTDRLDTVRAAPAGSGQRALDRDQEVHRLTARLRVLQHFGLDVCLGRMVQSVDAEPIYVGRVGLTDANGHRLLIDWRSPAAEPLFGATHGRPMGLLSRRRYRWARGRVRDYWDEVFTPEGLTSPAALDDQSAFIASLGASRTPQMQDVLGTIQADQDAIIRAGSAGALVVDGGPGTGKTVVALHRSAYLLYADPRVGQHRGRVLFIGPHQPYLAYVADVLPSLGEDGVQICTLRDLTPQGATAGPEPDARVAGLKATAAVTEVIDAAVRFYEEPPTDVLTVETPWGDGVLTPADWAAAFEAPAPGTPHNEAREEVWDAIITTLVEQYDDDAPPEQVRKSLQRNGSLLSAVNAGWPVVDPADLVGDLWSVPAYLRRCAPWLSREEIRALQREDAQAWTVADLPFLDAARQRLGDRQAARRARRAAITLAAERERMAEVIADAIAADDSEMQVMSMLRGGDLQGALVDESVVTAPAPDLLAGPFVHVVVDEAQELTDAEWQMVLARCPSRSLTIVGDRAQARHGFIESWEERLDRVGVDRVRLATLTINYRTPQEVMDEAEPVIRAALPDANVPTSIRRSGLAVRHGTLAEREQILAGWLAEHADGVACVIGASTFAAPPRVRSLTPEVAKGLEFDLVVLEDPGTWGGGVQGAVDRYVAMTRATQQLVILTPSRVGDSREQGRSRRTVKHA